MINLEIVKKICGECIDEGEEVLKTSWSNDNMGGMRIINPTMYVDLEKFKKWQSNCKVLINILGDLAKPWKEVIDTPANNQEVNALSILGALKSMKQTIDNGYLIKIEDLIFSEAFSNLLEQAEYLLEQDYFLASAVISRAVLEEKLRNICQQKEIIFSKPRPTLFDYNQELYKIKFYSKVEYKNIEYLTTIGNNAAHNKDFENDHASKMLEGVKLILNKYT